MKFGQLIEYKMFFFKNYPQNQAGRLVRYFSLFFEKALYQVKTKDM